MKKLILTILCLGLLSASAYKKEEKVEMDSSELIEQMVQEEAEVNDMEQPSELTSLALSENSHDFGDVKKGESVEHTYEVTNIGNNPLVISKVVPGCGCTAPAYTQEPILPGKKGQIILKFNSSNFEGAQQKQAQIFANVERSPIMISFTANVIKP